MDIILSEHQYSKLLTEEKKSEVSQSVSESKKFVKDVISDIKTQYKIIQEKMETSAYHLLNLCSRVPV